MMNAIVSTTQNRMQRYKNYFTYASAHTRKITENALERLKSPSPAISGFSDPLSIFMFLRSISPDFVLFGNDGR